VRLLKVVASVAVILALCAAGAVIWLRTAYPVYSYRYRLTIEIQLSNRLHTGSSVIEVNWVGQPRLGDIPSFLPSIRGQAALINLGAKGVIVAVLHPDQSSRTPNGPRDAAVLAARAFDNQSTRRELAELSKLSGKRPLAADNMPQLVWFANANEMTSARKVAPSEIPAVLGADARLAAASIEITGDPVVVDIDRKLPWLRGMIDYQNAHADLVREGDFVLAANMFVGEQR